MNIEIEEELLIDKKKISVWEAIDKFKLVGILILSIAGLLFTFGEIATRKQMYVDWQADFTSEIIIYERRSSGIELYKFNYDSIFKSDLEISIEYRETIYDSLIEIEESDKSSSEISKIASRINEYTLDYIGYYDRGLPTEDSPGKSILVVQLISLLLVQISTIAVIGLSIKSLKKKKLNTNIKKLLLTSGLLSLLFGIFVRNITGVEMNAGWGITIHQILMFIGFFILVILELKHTWITASKTKEIVSRYITSAVMSFSILMLVSFSFISISGTMSDGSSITADLETSELAMISSRVFSDSYSTSNFILSFGEYDWPDFSTVIEAFEHENVEFIVDLPVVDSEHFNDVLLVYTNIVAVAAILLMTAILFLNLNDTFNERTRGLQTYKIIRTVLIAILIVIALVYSINYNELLKETYTNFKVYVGIGLIAGFVLSVIDIFFKKIYNYIHLKVKSKKRIVENI